MTKNDDVAVGERFTVRLSSSKNCSTFDATIFSKYEDRVLMDSPDQLRIGPPLEPIRRRSPIPNCFVMDHFGEEALATVCDIGPNGLGIEGPVPYNPDESLQVKMVTCSGNMIATAKVVYCRAMDDQTTFRTGLSLQSMDRLSTGHWRSLLAA